MANVTIDPLEEAYLKTLYWSEMDINIDLKERVSLITSDEVEYAIKLAKNNKAVGPDKILAELLKLFAKDIINILVDLFNTIYLTGNFLKVAQINFN